MRRELNILYVLIGASIGLLALGIILSVNEVQNWSAMVLVGSVCMHIVTFLQFLQLRDAYRADKRLHRTIDELDNKLMSGEITNKEYREKRTEAYEKRKKIPPLR